MEYGNDNYFKLADGNGIFYKYLKKTDNNNTLVFINGFLQEVEDWNDVTQTLSSDFNILMCDLLAQGTNNNDTKVLNLDILANYLLELIVNLDIKKINIVGLDLGALVALIFSNNYSELVHKAILIGPIFGDRCQMILNDWKNITELLGDFALIQGILPWMFSHRFIESRQQELFEILDNMSEKIHLDKILKQLLSVATMPDVKELFNKLCIPYLVVLGEEDSLCSVSAIKETLMVSEEKIKIIKGCGHWVFYEEPITLSNIISDFCG